MCIIPFLSLGQFDTTWTRTYGGFGEDNARDIIKTHDEGVLIVGSTSSFGLGNSQIYFLKLDSLGEISWSRTYGGNSIEWANTVIQTLDHGYVAAGYTTSYGKGGYDAYIIKIDSAGNFMWDYANGTEEWNFVNDIVEISENQYVVAGKTYNDTNFTMDAWIFKISEGDQNPDWEKYYDSSGEDEFRSLVYDTNGILMVSGFGRSVLNNHLDALLCQYDTNGNINYVKHFGDTLDDSFHDIIQRENGDFVLVGYFEDTLTSEKDPMIMSVDSSGNQFWVDRWSSGLDGSINKVIEYEPNQYAVVGTTKVGNSEDLFVVITYPNGGFYWQGNTYGKSGQEDGQGIIRTKHGNLWLAGTTDSEAYDANFTDIFLLQTDSVGKQTNVDDFTFYQDINVIASTYTDDYLYSGIKVSKSNTSIQITSSSEDNIELSIYNISGQLLSTNTFNSNHSIDLSNLPGNVYIFSIKQNDNLIYTDKILKF